MANELEDPSGTYIRYDAKGMGAADEMIGAALKEYSRDSYCLVGAVGHDYYQGKRDGAKGYPRFTDQRLRAPGDYRDYLLTATEKALKRCQQEKFDLLPYKFDSEGKSDERPNQQSSMLHANKVRFEF